MKIINLFGEPSCGKSTTAAGLFFLMKHKKFNVELISEYAKDLIWENRQKTLNDQLYVTAKQNHKIQNLENTVDYVITDSPLLLGITYVKYAKKYTNMKNFVPLIKELHDSYDNLNILLTRKKPYVKLGRNQNEEEASFIRKEIVDLLNNLNIKYHSIDGDNNAPEKILKLL